MPRFLDEVRKAQVKQAAKEGIRPSAIKSAMLMSLITGKDFGDVLLLANDVDNAVNEAIAES